MALVPDYYKAEMVLAMPDDDMRHEVVWGELFVVDPAHADATRWDEMKSLRLVAEVLSPSTESLDRRRKRRLYQLNGVGTVWLIDPRKRVVEVWTPTATLPEVAVDRVTWHPAGAIEPLTIELAAIFG
jgi:hypothetical protein